MPRSLATAVVVVESFLLPQPADNLKDANSQFAIRNSQFAIRNSQFAIRNPQSPMPWLILIIAGLLEVGWAIGLKYTDGFNFRERPLACSLTLAAMIVSMYLLSVAVRTIPIGTGYAVWVGIGAVGAAILGMTLLKEPASAMRIVSLLLVVAGIVGLKLATPADAHAPDAAPERSEGADPTV